MALTPQNIFTQAFHRFVNLQNRILLSVQQVNLVRLFVVCLIIFSLLGLYSIIAASQYFGQPTLVSTISYRAAERPGRLLPSMYPSPFGVHYFGDFLDTLSHSRVADPFNTPGMSPVGYPLFSLLVITPFQAFEYHTALKIFLSVTALVLFFPLWKLQNTRPVTDRILFIASLAFTASFVSVLDRGNIQGLLVGFALIGLVAYLKGNHLQAGFWFAIAASMKVYPVLLLLLLVKSRSWKALALSILVGLFATWASFQFFDIGIISGVQDLWGSVINFRSGSLTVLTRQNHSIRGGFAALVILGPTWLRGAAQAGVDHYNLILLIAFALLAFLTTHRAVSTFSSVVYISLFLSYGLGVSLNYMPLFLFLVVAMIAAENIERSFASAMVVVIISFLLAIKGFPICQGIPLYTFADPLAVLLILAILVPQDLRLVLKDSSFRTLNHR